MRNRSYLVWVGTFYFFLKSDAETLRWEKRLSEGVLYIQETHTHPKLKVHFIKLFKGCPHFRLEAHVAKEKVLHSLTHRENKNTLSYLTEQAKAIASINGDYFISNGIPVGALMINGELVKKPYKNRIVFAWGSEKRVITSLEWSAQLIPAEGDPIEVKGFNEACPDNEMALYTPAGGRSLAKLPAHQFLLKTDNKLWTPNLETTLTPEQFIGDESSIEVPSGHIVIAVRGQKCALTDWFYSGTSLKLKMETKGINLAETPFMIGGGPWLCKDSKIYIDVEEQGFRSDISKGKNPRSAVGYDSHGDILLAMVEGRNMESHGATLQEMAEIMLKQGCTHAMNLDGGNSSSINFLGTRMSSLSWFSEVRIKTALMVRPIDPVVSNESYKIVGPSDANVLDTLFYEVHDEKGNPVPDAQIQWQGSHHLKVQPNGKVLIMQKGKACLKALVQKRWVYFAIDIVENLK